MTVHRRIFLEGQAKDLSVKFTHEAADGIHGALVKAVKGVTQGTG